MNRLLRPLRDLIARDRPTAAMVHPLHAAVDRAPPAVVLNDDDAASTAHLLEWLLIAIFPDSTLPDVVRTEMAQRLFAAASIGQARHEIQLFCQERNEREPTSRSADLLRCSLAHLELV